MLKKSMTNISEGILSLFSDIAEAELNEWNFCIFASREMEVLGDTWVLEFDSISEHLLHQTWLYLLDRFFEENARKLLRGVREISRRSTSEQRAAHNTRYARPTLESSCDNEHIPSDGIKSWHQLGDLKEIFSVSKQLDFHSWWICRKCHLFNYFQILNDNRYKREGSGKVHAYKMCWCRNIMV